MLGRLMFLRSWELGLCSEGGPGEGRLGEEGELLAAALALPRAVVEGIIARYLHKVGPTTKHVARSPQTIAILLGK